MRLFCDFYTLWVEFVKSRCIKGPSPSVVTGNVYNDFQFLRNNVVDIAAVDDETEKCSKLFYPYLCAYDSFMQFSNCLQLLLFVQKHMVYTIHTSLLFHDSSL